MNDHTTEAQEVADAVRTLYELMSPTDKKAIQAALLRANRKVLAGKLDALKKDSQ